MKIFKRIIAAAAVLLGVVFLFNSASDIQLGSGAILIAVGALGWE